jgi:hypothetical protein
MCSPDTFYLPPLDPKRASLLEAREPINIGARMANTTTENKRKCVSLAQQLQPQHRKCSGGYKQQNMQSLAATG